MIDAKILAYIDAEIALLKQVRDLLAGTSYSKKAAASARKVIRKVTPAVPETAKPTEQAVPVQRVPYKERKRGQRLAPASTSLRPAAALTGQVPEGPVVASADEARKARERDATQVHHGQPAPPVQEPGSGKSLGSLIQALASKQPIESISPQTLPDS